MKSLGAAVRTSNGRPPAARIASFTTGTMASRWLKQIASFDEELTMAILGLVMSSSVMPERAPLGAAHRPARSCPPGGCCEAPWRRRHWLAPATESCHGMTNRLVTVTAA